MTNRQFKMLALMLRQSYEINVIRHMLDSFDYFFPRIMDCVCRTSNYRLDGCLISTDDIKKALKLVDDLAYLKDAQFNICLWIDEMLRQPHFFDAIEAQYYIRQNISFCMQFASDWKKTKSPD